jgi:hypothetical protein
MFGWKDVLVQYEENKQMRLAAEHERLVQAALCCRARSFLSKALSSVVLLAFGL